MRCDKVNVVDVWANVDYFFENGYGDWIYFLSSICFWVVEKYCGKVEIWLGFAVGFGCGKVIWCYYRFEMWLVVVWWVGERSFCSQCVKRSPIDLPLAKGFSYGFFYPHNAKKSISSGMWYNTIVERERQRERATRTKSKKSIAFNPWYNNIVKREQP